MDVRNEYIEALGLVWEMGPNSNDANEGREHLLQKALRYLESIDVPVVRDMHADYLGTYPDILSAVRSVKLSSATPSITIEGLNAEWSDDFKAKFILRMLLQSPSSWVSVAREIDNANRWAEINALWSTASRLNPSWYSKSPLADAPSEVRQDAEIVLNATTGTLKDENIMPSEVLMESAANVTDFVQAEAAKKKLSARKNSTNGRMHK